MAIENIDEWNEAIAEKYEEDPGHYLCFMPPLSMPFVRGRTRSISQPGIYPCYAAQVDCVLYSRINYSRTYTVPPSTSTQTQTRYTAVTGDPGECEIDNEPYGPLPPGARDVVNLPPTYSGVVEYEDATYGAAVAALADQPYSGGWPRGRLSTITDSCERVISVGLTEADVSFEFTPGSQGTSIKVTWDLVKFDIHTGEEISITPYTWIGDAGEQSPWYSMTPSEGEEVAIEVKNVRMQAYTSSKYGSKPNFTVLEPYP